MKKAMIGLSGLLVSGPLLAHVGEHSDAEFISVILHLMSEHPLPLLLIGAVLGGLTVTRLLRS
ncbi:MAG: hypothetical protein ABW104_19695 [Candidatus Thiodiazotropha sp. 6PLUC2]